MSWLRWLVVLSTLSAVGAVLTAVERRLMQPSAPLIEPPPAEEGADSIVLARLRAIVPVTGHRHTLVVILDPTSPRQAASASRLRYLTTRATKPPALSFLFWTPKSADGISALETVVALECARRQDRTMELLRALGAQTARPVSWSRLAVGGTLTDLHGFLDCLRRRDTAREMSEELLIVKRLRIAASPSFVLDSTIIRGKISDDSLLSRLDR